MCRFAIRNGAQSDKIIGYLCYDQKTKEYDIEIPDGIKSTEAPPIISEFIQKGQNRIGDKWSRRWVAQRVIPAERQNIGQILRESGMQFYDEFPLLLMNQGRCCQDDCYLEKCGEQEEK